MNSSFLAVLSVRTTLTEAEKLHYKTSETLSPVPWIFKFSLPYSGAIRAGLVFCLNILEAIFAIGEPPPKP
jgi:hypothetical protein